jgi:O-acetyl-ADP-ribose deacetylase (regulator of RNase III)
MNYREIRGNIFNSDCHATVNTVNCVGVMGKGIALAFKQRYPAMFNEYRADCANRILRPGCVTRHVVPDHLVLNFAVKDHWRDPSKLEWVEQCLKVFVSNYGAWGIDSVAFPWMGAMNGRLPLHEVQTLMRQYLRYLPIRVEVYDFQP